MEALKKRDSFRTTVTDSSWSHLILVYGVDRERQFDRAFEQAVISLSHKARLNTSIFTFDEKTILENGLSALHNESQALKYQIAKLLNGIPGTGSMPVPFIFLAYHLGCWVVKKSLPLCPVNHAIILLPPSGNVLVSFKNRAQAHLWDAFDVIDTQYNSLKSRRYYGSSHQMSGDSSTQSAEPGPPSTVKRALSDKWRRKLKIGPQNGPGKLQPLLDELTTMVNTDIQLIARQKGPRPNSACRSIATEDASKISELKELFELANNYMDKGQVHNAEALFRRSKKMLDDPSLQQVMNVNDIRRLYITMAHAKSLLYIGRYQEAGLELGEIENVLRNSFPHDTDNPVTNQLLVEAAFQQATCFLRRGYYREARSTFANLNDLLQTLKDEGNWHEQSKESWLIITMSHLAETSAYLGDYYSAFESLAEISKIKRIDSQHVKYATNVAEGIVNLLSGDYSSSAQILKAGYDESRQYLVNENPKTLEVAALYALALMKTERVKEAHEICISTFKTLELTHGKEHPMTLHVAGILVGINLAQGSYLVALETARTLKRSLERAVQQSDPQLLRAKAQLSRAHLAIGNYRKAAAEWDMPGPDINLYNSGRTYPELYRHHAQRALAWYYCGWLSEAQRIAFETLRIQKDIFSMGKCRYPLLRKTHQLLSEVNESDFVLGLLSDIREQRFSILRIHPDLLFTLYVYAITERNKTSQNSELEIEILDTITQGLSNGLGDSHPVTLSMKHELAISIRLCGDLRKAEDLLVQVYMDRKRHLGVTHPDTLTTRSELIKTKFALEESLDCTSQLNDIYTIQEMQLGKYHPETLRTLLSLFTIQASQKKIRVEESGAALLERLEYSEVKGQRLVEISHMKETVALVYLQQGKYGSCIALCEEVIASLISATDKIDEEICEDESVQTLKRRVNQCLQSARDNMVH